MSHELDRAMARVSALQGFVQGLVTWAHETGNVAVLRKVNELGAQYNKEMDKYDEGANPKTAESTDR